MDTVYDKLTSESPYDAVSNGINSSVMVYKDGKDNSLVGGERERLIKEEAVNRFYEKIVIGLKYDKLWESNWDNNKQG